LLFKNKAVKFVSIEAQSSFKSWLEELKKLFFDRAGICNGYREHESQLNAASLTVLSLLVLNTDPFIPIIFSSLKPF